MLRQQTLENQAERRRKSDRVMRSSWLRHDNGPASPMRHYILTECRLQGTASTIRFIQAELCEESFSMLTPTTIRKQNVEIVGKAHAEIVEVTPVAKSRK
ncbi:hypothetical protein EVAR_21873_1 [Eumeta japonica]|uniref:Uncharacterized protein n=1 Tax=Eumeta variegata TaxID=151549 RepID=A0A4C1V946_EUMVA|nr:hypothetical protein EVAR_21873_1 [Eumeta japonica]